jgi:hypothetical protein
MIQRRLFLCSAVLIVSFAACGLALIGRANAQVGDRGAATQTDKAAAASDIEAVDIELGKPTDALRNLVTPLVEGGVLRDGHHGPPLGVQEFIFNPATHEIALAKNSPVQQQIYGHTRIDAAYFKDNLTLLNYLTSDRATIGKIVLLCANKKFYISPNYVVSIAQDIPPKDDPSTYSAAVQFDKGDECAKPGTTLTMHRNADPPAALADISLAKINRKSDVMNWTIERDGKAVQAGSFGFPVVGNEPNLVRYVIQLP